MQPNLKSQAGVVHQRLLLTTFERLFIILEMHKTFSGVSYSDAVSQALTKSLEGHLRFDLLKFIALRGECRYSQIRGQWSSEDVQELLEDLVHDLLIEKHGNLQDSFYTVNPEMFLTVLEEMSDSAKRCILDSENILLHSRGSLMASEVKGQKKARKSGR